MPMRCAGSTTKLYTTVATLRLAEEGKLQLDEPIAPHIDRYLAVEMPCAEQPSYCETSCVPIAHCMSARDPACLNVSAEARDLIGRMLAKDPRQRLAASGVLRHEWVIQATTPGRKFASYREPLIASVREGLLQIHSALAVLGVVFITGKSNGKPPLPVL